MHVYTCIALDDLYLNGEIYDLRVRGSGTRGGGGNMGK